MAFMGTQQMYAQAPVAYETFAQPQMAYAQAPQVQYAQAPQVAYETFAAPQVQYAQAPQVAYETFAQPQVQYAQAPQVQYETLAAPQVQYAQAPQVVYEQPQVQYAQAPSYAPQVQYAQAPQMAYETIAAPQMAYETIAAPQYAQAPMAFDFAPQMLQSAPSMLVQQPQAYGNLQTTSSMIAYPGYGMQTQGPFDFYAGGAPAQERVKTVEETAKADAKAEEDAEAAKAITEAPEKPPGVFNFFSNKTCSGVETTDSSIIPCTPLGHNDIGFPPGLPCTKDPVSSKSTGSTDASSARNVTRSTHDQGYKKPKNHCRRKRERDARHKANEEKVVCDGTRLDGKGRLDEMD